MSEMKLAAILAFVALAGCAEKSTPPTA